MSKIKLCFTGGGTAGHVIPNISIIQELLGSSVNSNFDIYYIGSQELEKNLIESKGYSFKRIQSGKLRRYFSWKNFSDLFKIAIGFFQSLYILSLTRPQLVFSKGGFVSVPVCYAAFVLRIPVFTHESDLSPGLATKLIKPIATKVLYTFEESKKYFGQHSKYVWVGSPIRAELFQGSKDKGLSYLKIPNDTDKKVILVMGGSLGSKNLNDLIIKSAESLCKNYWLVHITGYHEISKIQNSSYRSFSFIGKELADVLASSSYVVSRAGANAIYEFLSLEIPMLLVPLVQGSRGDQVQNAEVFRKNGWAEVLHENDATPAKLLEAIEFLERNQINIKSKLRTFTKKHAVEQIIRLIHEQIC